MLRDTACKHCQGMADIHGFFISQHGNTDGLHTASAQRLCYAVCFIAENDAAGRGRFPVVKRNGTGIVFKADDRSVGIPEIPGKIVFAADRNPQLGRAGGFFQLGMIEAQPGACMHEALEAEVVDKAQNRADIIGASHLIDDNLDTVPGLPGGRRSSVGMLRCRAFCEAQALVKRLILFECFLRGKPGRGGVAVKLGPCLQLIIAPEKSLHILLIDCAAGKFRQEGMAPPDRQGAEFFPAYGFSGPFHF